ncbi:YbdD/YjiX family protein [Azohydromonas caseinilytica]|uniref:YbdD/YjiX family protein n=1 Tax=Azohydromonas caseinilytica TaxID=2728836 RepID=A0A848FJH9_9BURK|nr:YbdD/YjiX family protein [Azohydromonas caseinilytica]NML18370.1 YbdD/YjiX family protein [Azohydromonas caseinilytica]
MSARPEAQNPAPARDSADGDAFTSLATRWRSVCSACRQVLGMPDYERYLAHAAARHPGAPVLTREEYSKRAIDRRYGGGGGMRCC